MNVPVFAVAVLVAYGGKAFFAAAGAEALGPLLGPTAALAGALAGERFEHEAGIGYLGRESAIVIAPACAGGNFLLVAFGVLVLCFGPRIGRPARRWGWLLAAAALAYAATIAVNAVRIALALTLREAPLPWLAGAQAHRVLGVAVYLGSLWLLVFAVSRTFARPLGALRAVLLPLGAYLALTLLVPYLNGAGARPGFWQHGRAVLALSLGLAAALLAAAAAVAQGRRGRGRSSRARAVSLDPPGRDAPTARSRAGLSGRPDSTAAAAARARSRARGRRRCRRLPRSRA
jgi:exosortase K